MALWERQKKESEPAYEAFWIYCITPKGEKRSYVSVAGKLRKSAALIRRWANRWGWEDRVIAYDNHLLQEEIDALKKDRIAAAKRHASIARSMQTKLIHRLNKLKPEELTPKEITSWLETAVKIERQALGEPTELIAQEFSGPGGGPIEIRDDVDLSKLTEGELILFVDLLTKSQIARGQGAQGEAPADDRGGESPPPPDRGGTGGKEKGGRKK
jgi:hypothetical protein